MADWLLRYDYSVYVDYLLIFVDDIDITLIIVSIC